MNQVTGGGRFGQGEEDAKKGPIKNKQIPSTFLMVDGPSGRSHPRAKRRGGTEGGKIQKGKKNTQGVKGDQKNILPKKSFCFAKELALQIEIVEGGERKDGEGLKLINQLTTKLRETNYT